MQAERPIAQDDKGNILEFDGRAWIPKAQPLPPAGIPNPIPPGLRPDTTTADDWLGPMIGGVGPKLIGGRILRLGENLLAGFMNMVPGGDTPRPAAMPALQLPNDSEQDIASKMAVASGLVPLGGRLAFREAGAITTPENMVARALRNRLPVKSPSLTGSPEADAVITAVYPKAGIIRSLGTPYRAAKASVQEAVAKLLPESGYVDRLPQTPLGDAVRRNAGDIAGPAVPSEPGPFFGNVRQPAGPPAEIPGDVLPKMLASQQMMVPRELATRRLLMGSTNRVREVAADKASMKLVNDPEFAKVAHSQDLTDQLIINRFRQAKAQYEAAYATAGSTVEKGPMLKQIRKIKEEFRVPAESKVGSEGETLEQFTEINKTALNKIDTLIEELDKQPDMIPSTRLRDISKALDRSIRESGGWKDGASSADKAMLVAEREIAGVLRNAKRSVSTPEQLAADSAYHDAMELVNASDMEPTRGYRVGQLEKRGHIVEALVKGKK